jgi:hypothetical protein
MERKRLRIRVLNALDRYVGGRSSLSNLRLTLMVAQADPVFDTSIQTMLQDLVTDIDTVVSSTDIQYQVRAVELASANLRRALDG